MPSGKAPAISRARQGRRPSLDSARHARAEALVGTEEPPFVPRAASASSPAYSGASTSS